MNTIEFDPISLFREWQSDAVNQMSHTFPNSCCLSTIDGDGHVDGRFVDIKEISATGFIFGTHLESPKARAIACTPRVSLTFWWSTLGRQVRVAGDAALVKPEIADRLFSARPRDAQAVSLISVQSQKLDNPRELQEAIDEARDGEAPIARPSTWGAYCVRPVRMEFLRFRETRYHERVLFVREDDRWTRRYLQP